MPARRPPLSPDPGGRGLATGDPAQACALVVAAYRGAAALARTLDLDAPSRLPGWTRRDVLVHLGAWDEHAVFARLLEDARTGRVHELDDADARNALLVAAHADADAEEVALALERAADSATRFLTSPEAETLGRRTTDSPVGPLPLTGVVVASAYEVAVHTLDVVAAADVSPGILDAGIAALVDVTGALAARAELATTFAVRTPQSLWACGVLGPDWITVHLDDAGPDGGTAGWPGLEGEAGDVLDAAAGRTNAAQLVLARRVRAHDVPALLALLPALEAVPGLPGGAAARAALRGLGQTGRFVSAVTDFARRATG